jgi:L-alanine-DL-glutamate epimerase-like enolase superfamily enzyme
MKIVRLKTAVVEGNFDWTFVRLETDEGISGLGECFFAPGLTSILRSLEQVIQGEDPRNIHRLFRKMQLAASGAGSVAGIVYNAISGIEAALWDLLGQWLQVPTYQLLATGENLFLFTGFREILQTNAVAIATPDLQKVGGFSVALQIAQFADEQAIPIAPHNISSPVGTIAAAHLCASIPNFLVLEFHAAHVPFWNDLIDGLEQPVIQDGFIRLPEKPGLGVKLNDEVARKYARKGEPFFQ